MGAVSSVVETVADTVGGVVEAVGDVGSAIDDAVNDVVPGGWATLAVVASPAIAGAVGVPASAIPYVAPATAGAVTLDQGGSLEDALLSAGLAYGAQQLFPSTDTTGLDMGDVIPTTPAQLEGLYPAGGTFLPPTIDTTGLDMGDVIPTTPMDMTSVIPEATPVAPSTTLPIEAQDPFGYKPPISLDAKTALNLANLGLTANAILNPPDLDMGGTGAGWYDLQPIPEGWSPPVYQTEFTPIDLASIFQGADLTGTQWANQMQPVQFAPAPTMQDLTNILQNPYSPSQLLIPPEAIASPKINDDSMIGPQMPMNQPFEQLSIPSSAMSAPKVSLEDVIGPQMPVDLISSSNQELIIPSNAMLSPKVSLEDVIGPQMPINTFSNIETSPITNIDSIIGPQMPNDLMQPSQQLIIPSGAMSAPRVMLEDVIGPQMPNNLFGLFSAPMTPSFSLESVIGPQMPNLSGFSNGSSGLLNSSVVGAKQS